jgi:hypothetical protein
VAGKKRERERDTLQEEIKGESMGRRGYAVKPRTSYRERGNFTVIRD